jgi:hypothetical protein
MKKSYQQTEEARIRALQIVEMLCAESGVDQEALRALRRREIPLIDASKLPQNTLPYIKGPRKYYSKLMNETIHSFILERWGKQPWQKLQVMLIEKFGVKLCRTAMYRWAQTDLGTVKHP